MTDHISIKFQEGSVKEAGVNGCQIEDVIDILLERLRRFQAGALPCRENKWAILHLENAQRWLVSRTVARKEQGVEGTTKKHK